MTFLPVVARELRVASRRRGTYWSRSIIAALGTAVFMLFLSFGSLRSPAGFGQELFVTLSICFFITTLLAGTIYTADSLSEEKREGTLGLLFLTDLRGFDVVMGKLSASSLGAVYGQLATLPVLAVPLLMGGVSLLEFGRVSLVLMNTLFFSLAVGMYASSLLRHGIAVMVLTFLLALLLNAIGPGVALLLAWKYPSAEVPHGLLMLSAGYALAMSYATLYSTSPETYWVSLGITHVLGWLFLALASFRIRTVWQEQGPNWLSRFRSRARRLALGSPEVEKRLRRQWLEINPCYWLAVRNRVKGWLVWMVLLAGAFIWLLGYLEDPFEWASDEAVQLMTMAIAHTVLRWWVGGEAVSGLGQDRQAGALELILSTPMSVSRVLHGRIMGIQRQFLGPVLVVLAVDFAFLLTNVGRNDESWWLLFYGTIVLVFLADLWTMAWLGMWQGVVQRRPSRALVVTGAWVFVVPWALFLTMIGLMIGLDIDPPRPEEYFFLCVYALLSVGIDLLGVHYARQRLLGRLRTIVAERTETSKGPSGRKSRGRSRETPAAEAVV